MISNNPGTKKQASFVKKPEQEWQTPGHAEYLITARLPEDIAPGPFTETLMIQTTCNRLKTYRLPVTATVTSFYTISPARQLLVRIAPPGKTLPPSTAKIEAEQPFEIQDLQCSTPDVLVSTRPGEAPNSIIIEATMNPEAKPGSQRNQTITFTIKSGDETLKNTIPLLVSAITPNTRGNKAPPPGITNPQSNAGPPPPV